MRGNGLGAGSCGTFLSALSGHYLHLLGEVLSDILAQLGLGSDIDFTRSPSPSPTFPLTSSLHFRCQGPLLAAQQ